MMTPDSPPSEDDQLMARLAGDDSAALERLMARWQSPLFRFIVRGVRDEGVAEELTQETFWRLWRARAQYVAGGKFSTWLFRIASRLCLDHYRRASRRPQLVNEEAIPPTAAPLSDRADRAAREAELTETLERALAGLPVNQRLALELSRFEGMSYKEIAETLDCSLGSVEQLIYRARRRLRRELDRYLQDGKAPSLGGKAKSTG